MYKRKKKAFRIFCILGLNLKSFNVHRKYYLTAFIRNIHRAKEICLFLIGY